MTISSTQPPEKSAQAGRIADIPRLAETLRQIEGMATFKAALPILRPFMRQHPTRDEYRCLCGSASDVLGSASFVDIIWRDLHGVWLTEGLLGATLVWRAMDGGRSRVEYLPKTQAPRVYALAQGLEESMREEKAEVLSSM